MEEVDDTILHFQRLRKRKQAPNFQREGIEKGGLFSCIYFIFPRQSQSAIIAFKSSNDIPPYLILSHYNPFLSLLDSLQLAISFAYLPPPKKDGINSTR
jgi:hypothetical protein